MVAAMGVTAGNFSAGDATHTLSVIGIFNMIEGRAEPSLRQELHGISTGRGLPVEKAHA